MLWAPTPLKANRRPATLDSHNYDIEQHRVSHQTAPTGRAAIRGGHRGLRGRLLSRNLYMPEGERHARFQTYDSDSP